MTGALILRGFTTYIVILAVAIVGAFLFNRSRSRVSFIWPTLFVVPFCLWLFGFLWRANMVISSVGGVPTATLTNVSFEPLVVGVIATVALVPRLAYATGNVSEKGQWMLSLFVASAAALLVGLFFPSLPE